MNYWIFLYFKKKYYFIGILNKNTISKESKFNIIKEKLYK